MCLAVMYLHQKKLTTAYFSQQNPRLPVKQRWGENNLIVWGRRKEEKGLLPLGGWAPLEAINRGDWDSYFPKPVKLPLLKFLNKDIIGHSH